MKAIYQGGESHDVAGYSFVAQVNYAGEVGRDSARVVSCNTTGISRVMHALHQHEWVDRARVVILRRGTDPWEAHANGMINTVIPETRCPATRDPTPGRSSPTWISPPWPEPGLTTSAASTSPWSRPPVLSPLKSCAMHYGTRLGWRSSGPMTAWSPSTRSSS